MDASGLRGSCARQGLWAGATDAVARSLRGATRRRGPRPIRWTAIFTASRPNQLWVAEMTYVPTKAGFLYLAVVLDAWSRKIVGWAMAGHLRDLAGAGRAGHGGRSEGPLRGDESESECRLVPYDFSFEHP